MTLAEKVRELSELKSIAGTLESIMEGLRLEIESEMVARSAHTDMPKSHATMAGAEWLLNFFQEGGVS